jgi:hypothetical protein
VAESAPTATSQPAEASGSRKKPDVDLEALEFAVLSAERRVHATEASARASELEAESKVRAAERELGKAEAALAHFEDVEVPTELAQRDLSIDRSTGRLSDSEAELAQLESMYADEEFAESSKELVLARSRRNVEFSKRSLELARSARKDYMEFDLAKKRKDAENKVTVAREHLEAARVRLEEARFGNETKALEAAESLRKAHRALDKAKDKAEASA